MKKIAALAATCLSLFVAVPQASAETYNSSRLASGGYVCPIQYGLGIFGSHAFNLSQVTCDSGTHSIPIRAGVECYSALRQQVNGVYVFRNGQTAQGVDNCAVAPSYPFAWTAHQGQADIAIDLDGTGERFSAAVGRYDGAQDANTSYTCWIQDNRLVKFCRFFDHDF